MRAGLDHDRVAPGEPLVDEHVIVAAAEGPGAEPVGLHDVRHSFVAVAFEQGLPVPGIAALARHASPKVTLGMYAGLTGAGREKAVAQRTEGGFGR